MFLDAMRRRVQGKKRRTLFVDGENKNVLSAAKTIATEELAQPIVMGDSDAIQTLGKECRINLDGIEIVDPKVDPSFSKYAHQYYKLREHKGISEEQAKKIIHQPSYFGAMMVHAGAADGMVSGLRSESKPFIPAFEIIGLRPEYSIASSVFILEWQERLLFFADCAVNPSPNAKELAEIAQATIETVRWLEKEPRVAFLSFSTYASAVDAKVDDVKKAVKLAKDKNPDVVLDGELQFDASFVPEVARIKAPASPFVEAGANVFIFPDLNSGNIAYKITERLGKARATGPILQGINKPVNDVSRGATVEDLVNAAVITAALSIEQK